MGRWNTIKCMCVLLLFLLPRSWITCALLLSRLVFVNTQIKLGSRLQNIIGVKILKNSARFFIW
jgi:hypothetical protein